MTDATELPTNEEIANHAALFEVWRNAGDRARGFTKELNGAVAKLETDLT